MKRSFILSLLVFTFFKLSAQAQHPVPLVYEIKAGTIGTQVITEPYLRFLHDPAGTISIDQAVTMVFKRSKDTKKIDENVQKYWFRFRIKNMTDHTVMLFFNANSDYDELHYLTPDGKWQHKLSGIAVPWSKKTDFKRLDGYYVTMNANKEYLFYERSIVSISSTSNPMLSFNIIKDAYDDLVFNYEYLLHYGETSGFLMGFAILAVVISLFFFYISREKLYLYFSLLNITFIFGFSGNIIKDLFFKESPGIFDKISVLIFQLFFYFLWMFLSDFFKTRQYYPRWTRLTNITAYWPFLYAIAVICSTPYFINANVDAFAVNFFKITGFAFSLNMIAIVLASIPKNRSELYFNAFLIAPLCISTFSFILVGYIVRYYFHIYTPFTDLMVTSTISLILFSYYWMVVMFLLKLVLRHQLLQKELLNEAIAKEKMATENEIEKRKLIALQKEQLEHEVAERTLELNRSLQRSDALLLNILPEDVAEELKEKGTADAHLFDEVTVLFTDFVNFTSISEQLSPQQLVDELHYCFKAFDEICTKYGIEKIKTIGDAYLAVAGLPNPDPQHAHNTVKAAQEIIRFIRNRRIESENKTFNIRIGINSGSVVAGIVGVKKFAYDIWGDTVNIAARMEQNSEPGKINVAEKTYELIRNDFEFTYRGEIEAKNKGALKMYFIKNDVPF